MSNLRFYSTEKLKVGGTIRLDNNAAHHATRVMRLNVGSKATLFNGDGFDYTCELTSIQKNEVFAIIIANKKVKNESPLNITLLQGISSGERMDYTIQKAVELGVTNIIPIKTTRSVVKLNQQRTEKRLTHWRSVIIAACEQSGRAVIPPIAMPTHLSTWLTKNSANNCMRIMPNPIADKRIKDLIKPSASIELLVGAEGGLTEKEINLASMHGFISAQLGQRILRTETAPLAAIAAMQTLWGDF